MRWFIDKTDNGKSIYFGLNDHHLFVIKRIDGTPRHIWEGRCSADDRFVFGTSLRALKAWAETYPES